MCPTGTAAEQPACSKKKWTLNDDSMFALGGRARRAKKDDKKDDKKSPKKQSTAASAADFEATALTDMAGCNCAQIRAFYAAYDIKFTEPTEAPTGDCSEGCQGKDLQAWKQCAALPCAAKGATGSAAQLAACLKARKTNKPFACQTGQHSSQQ